jgi:hypothetical protein
LVVASVKVTVWPMVGALGEKLKFATGTGVVGGVESPLPPHPAAKRVRSIAIR